MNKTNCPFCSIAEGSEETKLLAESKHSIAFLDQYPLNEGHSLIIPRKHEPSLFNLTTEERQDIWKLVDKVHELISRQLNPDGFNIGVNVSESAGQTVGHAHIHLIPRFKGDVPDPKGGVRWVIPERAPYWEE